MFKILFSWDEPWMKSFSVSSTNSPPYNFHWENNSGLVTYFLSPQVRLSIVFESPLFLQRNWLPDIIFLFPFQGTGFIMIWILLCLIYMVKYKPRHFGMWPHLKVRMLQMKLIKIRSSALEWCLIQCEWCFHEKYNLNAKIHTEKISCED